MSDIIPSLQPLVRLQVEVAPPDMIDPTGRRLIPILGGTVSGSLSGHILPGGADWQTIWPDGRIEINARYVLELDCGATVEVQSDGIRSGPPEILAQLGRGERVDPRSYYFRTAIRFRTVAPKLDRLNAMLALAAGARADGCITLTVFEVM